MLFGFIIFLFFPFSHFFLPPPLSSPPQFLLELEEQQLSKTIVFNSDLIDPAPFQLVERTSLTKVIQIKLHVINNHVFNL